MTWLPTSAQQAWCGKYCSPACCNAARSARWRARHPRPWRRLLACAREGCARRYLPVHPAQIYCTRRCAQRARTARRNQRRALLPRWLQCALPECERRFRPHDRQQLYCCDGHAIRARGRRHLAKVQGKPVPPAREKCTCGGDVRRDGSLYYCAQRCGWAEIRKRAA